jgi:hypothetical protein
LPLYQTLMATHWLPVAIVTSYGILILWRLAQSGRFGPASRF